MKSSNSLQNLRLEYNRKKNSINQRLKEFRGLHKAADEDIFSELCFCILTPQSRALYCDKAVKRLRESGSLFKGTSRAIKVGLKGVRFPNNKANYIIAARNFFKRENASDVKNRLLGRDVFKTREWLVKNIKGLGYKEASHFLRNIGLGRDMAILDIHILKNLKRYNVIRRIPSSISKNIYLDIEDRMRKFSRKINIPLEELDLLFWSNQTGIIFK